MVPANHLPSWPQFASTSCPTVNIVNGDGDGDGDGEGDGVDGLLVVVVARATGLPSFHPAGI